MVFIREGTLFAAPFDVDRLQLTGPPAPVLEDIALSLSTGVAQFAFASNGTFAYVPGGVVGGAPDPIEWMDRTGKISTLRAQPSNWSNPAFSPDGRRVAIDINDGKQTDVWVYEWDRDTLSRLTFDPANDWAPLWTPDGRRIVFASDRADKTGRVSNLYWQRADGAGEVQRLTESTDTQAPSSWQPTGRFLAFMDAPRGQNPSIMILPIEGDESAGWKPGKPTVFLDTPANEFQARFSPDGKWLAYMSNESGQNEVYVRPFPGSGGKWQISTDGGSYPVWSRTRPELFYVRNQRIMVATYAADRDSFRADRPRQISETPLSPLRLGNTLRTLDLHPDGERFALATRRETSVVKQDKVVFIFNFFDELRRIAPSGRSAVGSQQ